MKNGKFITLYSFFLHEKQEKKSRGVPNNLKDFAKPLMFSISSSANILTHQKPVDFARTWGCIFPSSSQRHQITKEGMMNGYSHKYSKANENQR